VLFDAETSHCSAFFYLKKEHSMSQPLVGIIANPASGRDIRRLVAYGTVFDNNEKTAIVRRVLLGLEAVGITRVAYLPEHDFGIVPRARCGQYRLNKWKRSFKSDILKKKT
jgi:predicted polyphosphate/ATP-dependent NAD kinase